MLKCGWYRHYKGNFYELMSVGQCTEYENKYCVTYRGRDGRVWIRPFDQFIEILPDGTPRFMYVGPSLPSDI